MNSSSTTPPKSGLARKARLLAYATITWNLVEAVVAIAAGLVAGSIALVGFGFDSTIEVFAAVVVLWRLRGDESREDRARRLIGITFFVLAAYVTAESVHDLATARAPDVSVVGIVLTSVSLVVMPALGLAKRSVGRRMGSRTLLADAAETLFCAYLSAIVLLGLALNALLGWWWADPFAALGIAYLAVREGREAWEDDHGGHAHG